MNSGVFLAAPHEGHASETTKKQKRGCRKRHRAYRRLYTVRPTGRSTGNEGQNSAGRLACAEAKADIHQALHHAVERRCTGRVTATYARRVTSGRRTETEAKPARAGGGIRDAAKNDKSRCKHCSFKVHHFYPRTTLLVQLIPRHHRLKTADGTMHMRHFLGRLRPFSGLFAILAQNHRIDREQHVRFPPIDNQIETICDVCPCVKGFA